VGFAISLMGLRPLDAVEKGEKHDFQNFQRRISRELSIGRKSAPINLKLILAVEHEKIVKKIIHLKIIFFHLEWFREKIHEK
jgi:hypothetical protein